MPKKSPCTIQITLLILRMTRKERLTERNKSVRTFFSKVSTSNPKWRIECIIEAVADKFYIAPRTVEAILGNEGVYNDSITTAKTQQMELF